MKLELRDLAPYLPYGVKMIFEKSGDIRVLNGLFIELGELRFHFNVINRGQTIWNYKPILRPLSDLNKEIEVNGERFVPLNRFNNDCFRLTNYHIFFREDNSIALLADYRSGYNILSENSAKDRLLEWHFDIFGLIEKGLAINYNEIHKDNKDDLHDDTFDFNKRFMPE